MQVISQSKDGKRAMIVVHGKDHLGRKTSQTRHVEKRGSQWEYAPRSRSEEGRDHNKPLPTSSNVVEATVLESYEVGA